MSNPLNDLQEIRKMMEKSSRFLSLSGLSGVAAGVVALAATFIAYLQKQEVQDEIGSSSLSSASSVLENFVHFLVKLAVATLVLAVGSGILFTWRKAKGNLWNAVSRKLVGAMLVPLLAGGAVILAMLGSKQYGFIPELTLIFYGLALVNASQYTYRDVYFLGLCEILIGVIALVFVGNSLLFWALGFGVMHILYGISMYYKYDRKSKA